MAEILDLDELAPEKKEASFTDRKGKKHTFDISFISFKTGMIVIKNMDVFEKIQGNANAVDSETFNLIIDIIANMCSESDEEITSEFLQKNINIPQATALLQNAMEPLMDWISSNIAGEQVEKGKAKGSA